MTLDNTITRINKNPPKSLPTLECMLWKAKSNHLDFKQMSLGDHEENGVLFLKLDFNDQSDDSKSLNKITNQSLTAKSPWHITVGHFNNVNNAKRERLKRFKEKLRPRLKCMDTCVGNVQLETVRIVHTDNAKAQYSLYNKPYQPPTSPPTGCQ